MEVVLKEITIRELTAGYVDRDEDGVVGFGGELDIRPPYQREFIYSDRQRDAVIATVKRDFPLNVMYWAVREDGGYEVIDGQQRTISVCQYVDGVFSYDGLYFHNLQADQKEQILDYKLMIYWCSGTDSERLEWFKTINIAGEELTDQELRNAVYAGPWVSDAKRHFSKTQCPAYNLASDLMKGAPNRQDYLETVIRWINAGEVVAYMSEQQHKANANELWLYFQAVVAWTRATFPRYRSEMKGLAWGDFYNRFKDEELDAAELEKRVAALMEDEEVTKRKGIYEFVLDGQERHLNLRAFTLVQKRAAYERQEGICPVCGEHFEIEEMEGDHITPWHDGGKTIPENCQMLCKDDNRRKGGV